MQKHFKILIIEDSVDDLELYRRILQKLFSCSITHFSSATVAFDNIIKGSEHYDIMFLDYNLPGLSGMDFLKKFNQLVGEPHWPIIVLTGQGGEKTAVTFMQLGVYDYIQKSDISIEVISNSVERAITQYNRKKIEKEKQKELLLFAHTLAHDLKNPIARIAAFCKLSFRKPENQAVYLEHIAENASYLTQFIDQLLSYAEYGRKNPIQEEVDLSCVVSRAISNLDVPIAQSNAKIEMQGEFSTVIGCKISLIQLFQNIIANSVKYCATKPVISIQSTIDCNKHIISIKDNGIGIPQGSIDSIFKPFMRIKNNLDKEGTGLGLALVKIIANQHNAELKVESSEGGGTKFDITFALTN